ncbi:MAG: DNA polymerase/3'-5' exonuclease PolX [Patescibacteria group bacterium]|nr:DNA polymerase/3'-5' exonuclease PolX [Patescibacteria group bacterium]
MAKYFTNKEISRLLEFISAAYEIKNADKFRILAYQRAAVTIEHLSREVKDYYDEGRLSNIPGVGPSIAQHLDELFKTGNVQHFKEITKGIPPSVSEFINVSGIGPKTAFKLAKELNIWSKKNALDRLKKAAEDNKIEKISSFGKDTQDNILQALLRTGVESKNKERMLLPYAYNLFQEIEYFLKKSQYIDEVKALGSLRRKNSTIGDIDLAIKTSDPSKAIIHVLKFPKIEKVLNQGNKKITLLLTNNIQIDIRAQDPSEWGSMLQHFTGSKDHNIKLREFARKKNFSLSEYGIKNLKSNKLMKFNNEIDFYQKLGLDFIPPEIREDDGEIEAALNHNLPKLVKLKDIKGDLHLHSNYPIEPSHDLGKSTFEQMIKKANTLDYKYLGFSEHNPSQNKHDESDFISILKDKRNYIDKLNYSSSKKYSIKIFNGLEIDIKPDGNLAIPDKALSYLDYGIASIHTNFNMNKKAMTDRIIKGLSHPKVKILGHPTGRKIQKREAYEADWEKIFEFCLKNNKALEINSWPERQDLPDTMVKRAIKAGVLLVINSDSHRVNHMDLMKYGVYVAQRGWAERKDILNTQSTTVIKKFFNLK